MINVYLAHTGSETVGAKQIARVFQQAGVVLVDDEDEADYVVQVRSPGAPAGFEGWHFGTVKNSAIGEGASTVNFEGDVQAGNLVTGQQMNFGDQVINAQGMVQHQSFTGEGKEALQSMLAQLRAELANVPAEHTAEAEYVQQKAEQVVSEATSDKPKWWQIQIEGEALKKAAENIANVTPTVLVIAGQILAFIAKAATS